MSIIIATEFVIIALTFVGIFSCFKAKNRINFTKSFFVVLTTHVLVYQINPQACILVDAIAAAIFTKKYYGKWSLAFYTTIRSAMILTIMIIISGNIEQFILYKFIGYDEKISMLVVAFTVLALVFPLRKGLKRCRIKFFEDKSMIVLSVYDFTALIVFYVGIPIIYKSDKENMLLMLLFLIFMFAGVGNVTFSTLVNHLEQKKMENDMLLEKKLVFEKEQTEIRMLKHLFSSRYQLLSYYIYKNDFEGLKRYYKNDMVVLGVDLPHDTKTADKIENIKDETIKIAVFGLFNKCTGYGIGFKLTAETVKSSGCMSASDLLSILGIFAENAYHESKNIDNSMVCITIMQDLKRTTIQISNTYGDLNVSKNKESFDIPIIEKRYGKGLLIASELCQNSDDLSINTWKNGNTFTQQIVIEKKYAL